MPSTLSVMGVAALATEVREGVMTAVGSTCHRETEEVEHRAGE